MTTPPNAADQTETKPAKTANTKSANSSYVPPTPQRCFIGAAIAGVLGFALYNLTLAIIATFAAQTMPSGSTFALRIAIAVRTLVVGASTLGTGIFVIATLGLTALGIQLLVQPKQAE
jgi:hypothetical protein